MYELNVHCNLILPRHSKAGVLPSPSVSLKCLTPCLAFRRHAINAYSMNDEGKLKPEKSRDLNNSKKISLFNKEIYIILYK